MEGGRAEIIPQYFTKSSDLVTRRIAGECIIVPIRSRAAELDFIYRLNELGSFIWERLNSSSQLNEIVDAICSEYETTPEEASEDLREFLHSLSDAGLINASMESEGVVWKR